MEKVMEKLKATNILGLVGNIIIAVSVFLPIITISVSLFGITQSQSVSYIQGNGVFVLILAIINIVLMFADKIGEKVEFFKILANPKFTLIPTALILVLLLVLTFNGASSLGAYAAVANISYGIGYWLLWIGVVASAAYPFLYKGNTTK